MDLIPTRHSPAIVHRFAQARLAKAGLRSAPLDIDLSERIEQSEAYAPAVSSNLSASDESASFFKYKYAERATRDGTIPTTEELKGVCVKEMNANHSHLLQCDVQKILKEAGHTWLWTRPTARGCSRSRRSGRTGRTTPPRRTATVRTVAFEMGGEKPHRSPCRPLLRPDDEGLHGRPSRRLVRQRCLP